MYLTRTDGSRLALGLLALSLAACGTLTVPQEKRLGAEVARDMQKELHMMRDKVVVDYVADIGEELVRAAGPQPFQYHFFVVIDENINAFAAPAGYIYVHTELILRAANVSELAGVMAHEVGHVAHRHVAENYNRSRNANILYQVFVVGASFFGYGSLAQLGGGLAAMAVLNTFGREAERESDTFAVGVMPNAGYDPSGLVTFFETLKREAGPSPPAFLSSHPTTADRIAETSSEIALQPPTPGLKVTDRGKLEIIQQRIRLLTGQDESEGSESPPGFEPL